MSSILRIIGPGMLVAATGIGAGDLATAAFTGSKLGVGILWAVVVGAFLKFVLNEGLARWQLATGETLLEGAVTRLGRGVQIVFLPYLLLWSFFVGTAMMAACGVTMHAICPVFSDPSHGKIVFGVLHSILGVALVLAGGFALFEKLMNLCIVGMFVIVVVTAFLICQDFGPVFKGLVVPSIPASGGDGLSWTIALMGGVGGTLTVLCYGYWIREKKRDDASNLKVVRLDLGCAYAITAIFGIAMVVIGSHIEVSGKGSGLVVNLARALEDLLGPVGKWAFLIGAWGAVFSSLFGVWQAVPYIFADFWRLIDRDGRGNAAIVVDTRGRAYRGYLLAIAVVPMIGLLVDFTRIQKVYAVFGALFMPLLAIVLLLLNGKADWVHRFRNAPATVGILLATLVIFAFFGYLQVRKSFGF